MQTNATSASQRRPWTSPVVQDLPRLTELTLVTNSGIDGNGNIITLPGGGSGGSTVIP